MIRRILSLLLCILLCFSLFGCGQEASQPPETTAAPTAPPTTQPSDAELYEAAAAPVREALDLWQKITVRRTIDVGTQCFTLDSTQELACTQLGTENFQASLLESMETDAGEGTFSEFFYNDTLYVTAQEEYRFSGTMTSGEFAARFAPAVMLNAELYADVTAAKDGDQTLYIFATPSAAEQWALPERAVFTDASGTALVDANGILCESTYTIEYTYAGMQVTEEYQSTVDITDPAAPTPLESASYTALSDIRAPRLYTQALLHLASAEAVTSNTSQSIVSQAAALIYADQTAVNFHGVGDDHVSQITYSMSLVQSGETSTYTQTERYQDGVYAISADGGEPEESTEVTAADMYLYCFDYLVDNTLSLEYITEARSTETAGTIFLEFECGPAGDALKEYACSVLFEDPAVLDEASTNYAPGDVTAYLAVDSFTGFPTALGMQYSGTHTIDDADYLLTLQADQSLYLASRSAYETVTGALLPEEAPETTATPLFYRVTGGDGQEMYLLGTIHAGDTRTAYLPQAIYDALDTSDALAVEFDTIAFEANMASDPELAAQVAAAYIYTDGTVTKNHLEEAAYHDAVKLLKASGNYNTMAELMKPSIWQQSISNFYLQQGYGLEYDKGVDVRLLKLAKDADMEILDIESGLAQMQMMAGYSDELQAYLLEDALSTDPVEYYQGVAELYELWCQGDETLLRKAVMEDTSEMAEEELALFEEYWKALSTDRNQHMLEAAVAYLESGDTIFYAVGLAHLLADDGLVNTLRDAGYTVEQVTYK